VSTFTGFPVRALDFYDDLEVENTKAFWDEHRRTYDDDVRAPMQALVAALEPEFGTAKVFRPYRDVRFSHDKTPYKTHQGAVVHADGAGTGAWYVQISAEGLTVAGGSWRLESDQVARYRRAVADELQGPRLQAEVDRLATAGWDIRGEKLSRVPAGFSKDAERLELLRHKSLHAARTWEPVEWLHQRRALEEVRTAWRDLRTLNAWLADNIGATTKESRTRR
jgi:uncharacterized protein (TIGR02453 family)